MKPDYSKQVIRVQESIAMLRSGDQVVTGLRTIIMLIIMMIIQLNCLSQENQTKSHFIGEKYGGGIVFYITDQGRHGLICASKDIDYFAIWGEDIYTTKTAKAFSMTYGAENTGKIYKCYKFQTAASRCADTVIEGFNDWYLPSVKELSLLYAQSVTIGGFAMGNYWSSTEQVKENNAKAWSVNFGDKKGREFLAKKRKKFCIRPIRKF